MSTKREVVKLSPSKIIEIGLFSGLFWGIIFLLLFYLNLSEFGPSIVLKIFLSFNWVYKFWGQLGGLALITAVSIGISLLYYIFFKRLEGMLPGIILGGICFLFFTYVSRPFLTTTGSYAEEFGVYTVVAMACIFVLWGITISYSISFESNNETLPGSIYSKRN